MTTSTDTPMMRQYRQIKAQYPDTILLWRLGDFYEAFDDDAKLIASALGVTLTRRSHGKSSSPVEMPMAGVPYHSVDKYVAKLLELGYRVAIAEQTSPTEASERDTRSKSSFQRDDLMRDRSSQKGTVDREVVRVLTPGTVTEPELMNAKANNYLAAVLIDRGRIGLAYTDLSTGQFAATELGGPAAMTRLNGELTRLQPAEILVSDDAASRPPQLEPASARLAQNIEPLRRAERERLLPSERVARKVEGEAANVTWVQGRVTPWSGWRWELRTASDALKHQFKTNSLDGFGLSGAPLGVRAAGALLQYLHETQRSAVDQIDGVRLYSTDEFMFLDPQTRRNLELMEGTGGRKQGSLIDVLDQTRTPMGARLLRSWLSQPLLDRPRLLARQAAIAQFVDDAMLRATVRDALKGVGDLERVVNRILQGTARPADLVALRQGLERLPSLVEVLSGTQLELFESSTVAEPRGSDAFVFEDDLFADEDEEEQPPEEPVESPRVVLDPCTEVLKLLQRAICDDPPALLGGWSGTRDRNVIRPGFDPQIDQIVRANADASRWMQSLQAREIERTGIKSLKVDSNSVFGYYIEISRATPESMIPPDYIRKQTLVGAERYITQELKEYESLLTNAERRLNDLEREAFKRVCGMIGAQGKRLLNTARSLAQFDVFAALADVAVRGRYVRPALTDDTTLEIVGGRHPVVEQMIEESFVPNDAYLDTDNAQILVITGPNMSGKSVFLRQVALIVLLAQIGSFVPADRAVVGLVDRIFTRIGAQDDLATGQSTFMIEMTESANILHNATRRSLIVLDELGRGTSTYDGLSIARSVIEYIHNHPRLGARTLFATHYHELTELADVLPRVRNYNVAVTEEDGTIVFLRRIVPGGADQSYGIHVAELAGMPPSVVRRAAEVLQVLEGRGDKERQREAMRKAPRQRAPDTQQQMPLFAPEPTPSPVVELLKNLDVTQLTPLEALTKLYELQQMAGE